MTDYRNLPYAPQANPGEPTRGRSNGLAVAGMVCGIIGLLLFNIFLGPLAIIFGSVGLSRANRGASHRKMALAGIILGILDIVILVGLIAASSRHGGNVYFHVG